MAVWEFITCFQASHSHKLSRLTYICPNLCPTSSATSRLSIYAALIPVMTHLTCSLICRMTYRQALDTRFPSSNISAKTRSVHSSSRVVSSQTSLGGRLMQVVFHPSPTNDSRRLDSWLQLNFNVSGSNSNLHGAITTTVADESLLFVSDCRTMH